MGGSFGAPGRAAQPTGGERELPRLAQCLAVPSAGGPGNPRTNAKFVVATQALQMKAGRL